MSFTVFQNDPPHTEHTHQSEEGSSESDSSQVKRRVLIAKKSGGGALGGPRSMQERVDVNQPKAAAAAGEGDKKSVKAADGKKSLVSQTKDGKKIGAKRGLASR